MKPVPYDVLDGLTEKLTITVLFRNASFIANASNEGESKSIADAMYNHRKFMSKPPYVY